MRTLIAVEPLAAPDTVLAVRLDAVTVRFRVTGRLSLKETLIHRRLPRGREHLALDRIDFEARQGEAVGIIGANGAGKSTLLRVIAGILQPTSGRVRIRGRIAPLLDLISAFHADLTGRENIALQMAILGARRDEVRARLDEIAAFADLGEFLDAPLRTYSAGMTVRLGFATISSADAEVMVIDEALGAGDQAFQEKCAARIAAMREGGRTFVVVSHDLSRLRTLCDRLVWLDHGRVRDEGDPATIIQRYAASLR
jgi:ABC-type polysaccharide/polyol phosphate transport system ATPase subunit